MNDKQLEALKRFIALMDGDDVAQAELKAYGNAYEHLVDYVVDQLMEVMQ